MVFFSICFEELLGVPVLLFLSKETAENHNLDVLLLYNFSKKKQYFPKSKIEKGQPNVFPSNPVQKVNKYLLLANFVVFKHWWVRELHKA